MPRETARRDEVAQAATDYVLEHGLVGLSLRPLAAELGTSDRMLLYHFGSKDDLVATVLRVSNDRSVAEIRALPPSPDVRSAVLDLWAAVTLRAGWTAASGCTSRRPPSGCSAASPTPPWCARPTRCGSRPSPTTSSASGTPRDRARRAVALLDAALMGFQLDLPLDAGDPVQAQARRRPRRRGRRDRGGRLAQGSA